MQTVHLSQYGESYSWEEGGLRFAVRAELTEFHARVPHCDFASSSIGMSSCTGKHHSQVIGAGSLHLPSLCQSDEAGPGLHRLPPSLRELRRAIASPDTYTSPAFRI